MRVGALGTTRQQLRLEALAGALVELRPHICSKDALPSGPSDSLTLPNKAIPALSVIDDAKRSIRSRFAEVNHLVQPLENEGLCIDDAAVGDAVLGKEVKQLSLRFAALNPYDTELSSILKIERDNYDPVSGEQRQLYCFAISAKRYGLFLLDEDGVPSLLRKGVNNHEDGWSEHGLGHLKNPTDLESDNRDWIAQAWTAIIRRSLGLYSPPRDFEHLPAIGRITINNPADMRSLAKLNIGRKYASKLKPFNFLLTCHVKPFGYPPGTDPERFHLIAPYEPDPPYWLEMPWIDRYTGEHYRIITEGFHGSRTAARVKTYGDVLRGYEFHPGSKNADAKGKPSGKQSIGLLQRRHIRVARICLHRERVQQA